MFIEIKAGQGREPTKADIQKNINALTDVIDNIESGDFYCVRPANLISSLNDTRSILEGIQRSLPNE